VYRVLVKNWNLKFDRFVPRFTGKVTGLQGDKL
jgi:hypothetical protein